MRFMYLNKRLIKYFVIEFKGQIFLFKCKSLKFIRLLFYT
jgi:hypothetical protein